MWRLRKHSRPWRFKLSVASLTKDGVSRRVIRLLMSMTFRESIRMITLNYKVCSRIPEEGKDSLREIDEAIENLTERFPRAPRDQN